MTMFSAKESDIHPRGRTFDLAELGRGVFEGSPDCVKRKRSMNPRLVG